MLSKVKASPQQGHALILPLLLQTREVGPALALSQTCLPLPRPSQTQNNPAN